MFEQKPTSYDVSDEELVARLMRVTGEVGTAVDGLSFDPTGGRRVTDMHYYKGVVLARLAGKKPPYEPGARMVVLYEQGAFEKSHKGPMLPFSSEHVVDRVWYVEGEWYLEFKNVYGDTNSPLYSVSAFQFATSSEALAVLG